MKVRSDTAFHPGPFSRLASLTWFAVLACLACLCGCFQSNSLAGGTSETTNGDYAASVARADGTPLAQTWVRLVDDGDWAAKIAEGRSVILDSALTDSTGAFRVKVPSGQRCNLQIDAQAEALFLRDIQAGSQSAIVPKLAVLSAASLTGQVHSDSGTIKELRLAGTAYRTLVGADSTYAFAKIAPGSYDMVAVLNRNGALVAVPIKAVDLAAGENKTGFDLGVAASRVVVDDFEPDFWYQTELGAIAGGGWTATQDGSATVHSAVFSSSAANGQAYSGKSLATEMVFRAGDPAARVRVGFTVDASINLSKLSAVSFYAMGTGKVYLRFHSRSLNAASGDSVQFQYPIDLRSSWTHIHIPADSLVLTPNAPAALLGRSWDEFSKDVLGMDFVSLPDVPAGADSVAQSLRLDDLSFEGVTPQSLKE